MRPNYLAKVAEEAILNDEPRRKVARRGQARSLLTFLIPVATLIAIPYLLVKDLQRVTNPSPELARSSESALASGEVLVQGAVREVQYAIGWISLVWSNL